MCEGVSARMSVYGVRVNRVKAHVSLSECECEREYECDCGATVSDVSECGCECECCESELMRERVLMLLYF